MKPHTIAASLLATVCFGTPALAGDTDSPISTSTQVSPQAPFTLSLSAIPTSTAGQDTDTAPAPAPASGSASAESLSPFAEGARYFSLTLGTSRDPSLGRIYLTQFSVDHYLWNDIALRAGFIFAYADARRNDDGVYGGPELGLRWHFLQHDRFSLHLDGSVAAVFHEHPLTENSLRFNFDLQAGLGAMYQLSDDLLLQGGVRWHHLSNARIRGKSRNLGYDGPMLYLGFLHAF